MAWWLLGVKTLPAWTNIEIYSKGPIENKSAYADLLSIGPFEEISISLWKSSMYLWWTGFTFEAVQIFLRHITITHVTKSEIRKIAKIKLNQFQGMK